MASTPGIRATKISPLAARRFLLRRQGLERPFADIASVLTQLGYVQIDPINICGRMHDLILRNRVAGYREGDLGRHLHGNETAGDAEAARTSSQSRPAALLSEWRVAFEHHHPETNILVAFPLDAWPHLLAAMEARTRRSGAWSGRLTPRERDLARQLIAEIAARGPLGSKDFEDQRPAHRVVWGASTMVKTTLQKLFFHGRLLIAQRSNNRRRYDLPERVLPAPVLALPKAPASETTRWLALLKLRQRRLAVLKKEELRAVADAVQAVTIEGCPPLYCLAEDSALLAACEAEPVLPPAPVDGRPAGGVAGKAAIGAASNHRTLLLAPLDPLIYDRRVTAALWNFDYTWEAYTPAAKRVRGHYALPVLVGTELVGHVEPKADRSARKLTVASRSIRRGYSTAEALDELAQWLGVSR